MMIENGARLIWRLLEPALRDRGYALRWSPLSALTETGGLTDPFPLAAAHLTLHRKDVFFVEIGANDGVSNDPIFPFVRDFGWSGIALEPVPTVYAKLQQTYENQSKVRCLNCAIAQEDGTATFYMVAERRDADGKLSDLGNQLSSFNKSVILKHVPDFQDLVSRIREIQVETVSWKTLAGLTDGKHIDVVQIDTEGFDAEIVRMLDLSREGPSLIHFEHKHLSKSDQNDCAERLTRHGYRLAFSNTDTTAYRY